MNKAIVIYKGDEYRAKIFDKIYEDELFADLYINAFKILNEIVDELSEARGKCKESQFLENMQGMGNNIIVFSGQRGQGKTSIMQSFSKWLKNDISADRIIDAANKNKEWEDTVKAAKENKFLVLPTIDPSSLSKNESIVQSLMTKLFYVFSEYVKRSNDSYGVEQEKKAERLRKEAVPLFQKCFTNIDYLKLGRNKEWEIDDLELLSEISNSSAFKNNLSELIDILLNHICGSKEDKNFLVIPIDDTDLATFEAFNICEDIRNYFSIPNVIVLMAADYKQLTYAVTQQYLVNYEKFRTSSLGEGFNDNNCYEIAVQYLEKVLPSGHRIDLPKIDAIIKENREGVSFRYIDKAGSKETELLNECYGDERGIHNQLANIIYKRTGIIFDNKSDLHPFLPQKMRELTHFVKLLADMADIDCDQIYLESGKNKKDAEFEHNLEKLRKNIDMLIQYFLDYWCTKHLNISEKEKMENFDLAMRNHDKIRINKILQSVKKVSQTKKSNSFRNNLFKYVGISTDDMSPLQNAIRIYYTLYMNMWYAETLSDERQIDQLSAFVEKAVFFNELTSDKDSVIDFQAGSIANLKESDNLEEKTFYNAFCYQRDREERFSLLGPLLGFIPLDDKNGDEPSSDTLQKNMGYYIATRNIVANYDNQCFYSSKIHDFSETTWNDKPYSDIAAEFYTIFSDEKYTGQNVTIAGVLRPYILHMAETINTEYNRNYRTAYYMETFQKKLLDTLSQVSSQNDSTKNTDEDNKVETMFDEKE